MKFKIVLTFLILLIGISAVFAENSTNTFEDLQSTIDANNQIIYLNNSNYIGHGNEIVINKDLTIDGAYSNGSGRSTLDANGLSRIFSVENSYNIVLKNLNFINGKSTVDGGAISFNSNGKLTIYNCKFINNTGANGGAIYCKGSLNASVSSFINNSCTLNANVAYGVNKDTSFKDCLIVSSAETKTSDIYIKDIDYKFASYSEDNEELDDSSLINPYNPLGLVGNSSYQLLMYNITFNGTLPSVYDLRKLGLVGPVKNQGSSGSCWAQATLSTLESNVLKAINGDKVLNKGEGFSAENLLNLMIDYVDSTVDYTNGGQFDESAAYLVSWLGPAYESDDPFKGFYHSGSKMSNIIHIQNCYRVPQVTDVNDINTRNALKEILINYGAIRTLVWTDDGKTFPTYSYTSVVRADHAVCVVGWDDTISRYNFVAEDGSTPPGDGAWIIQNSWGSSWGHGGFGYVSFYDRGLLNTWRDNYVFLFNDTIRFNKNYQKTLYGKSNSHISGLEINKSESFIAIEDDYLAAFSSVFWEPCDYTVNVYINGNVVLTQSGRQTLPGYFTIELSKFIPLKKGDDFKINITYKSIDGVTPINVYSSFGNNPMIKAFTSRHLLESIGNKVGYAKDGSEIFLNNKTYWASEGEKTVVINKNIVINGANNDGKGYSTIDGNNLLSLFRIAQGYTVTLKNLNIINSNGCAVTVDYGAIANIFNCNFSNNFGDKGNSIDVYGQATVENSIFANENTVGLGEIYVKGTASFKNNKISSKTAEIYNEGTINSQTNLVFDNINTYVGIPTKLTASLTDDNGNSINSNSPVNLNGFGNMVYSDGKWNYDYTPSAAETKTLSGSANSNLASLNIQSGSLKVQQNAPISIVGGTFNYGTTATVTLTVDPNKKGNYKIYVGGQLKGTYNVNSPVYAITFNDLNNGVHKIKAVCGADSSYAATADLTINKVKPTLSVSADNIVYGQKPTINVALTGVNGVNLNGNVAIDLNGVRYNVDVRDGRGTLALTSIYGVKAHMFTASIAENGNYLATSCEAQFRVLKAKPVITVDVDDFTLGEAQTAKITISSVADGQIIHIKLDHNTISSREVRNGQVIYEFSTHFYPGERDFYVTYDGDENHYAATSEHISLKIFDPSGLSIQQGGVFAYGDAYVDIISSKLEPVKVYVDNNYFGTYNMDSNKLRVYLPGLTHGSHTIRVEYANNPSVTVETGVNVNKINGKIQLFADNLIAGGNAQLTIILPEGTSGTLTVMINNVNDYVDFTDGKATYTIPKITQGVHEVWIGWAGDNRYNIITDNFFLKVVEKESGIQVDVKNINVGQDATITVTVPDDTAGKVAIEVGGKTYLQTPTNGIAIFTIPDLQANSYNVKATIAEDSKYSDLEGYASFTVTKFNPSIAIDVADFKEGESGKAIITMDSQATGTVKIYLNNKLVLTTQNTNGRIEYDLSSSLTAGNYQIYVSYDGNDLYNAVNSNVDSFKILAKDTISVADAKFDYGAQAFVTVNPSKSGSVNVYVDGTKIGTYSVTSSGTNINLPTLNAGTYDIKVEYVDDAKIFDECSIEINKVNPKLNINFDNVVEGNPVKIDVTLNGVNNQPLNGVVVLNIAGKPYDVTVSNGRGSFTLAESLKPDSYIICATFNENGNYNTATIEKTLTVSKKDPVLSISSNDFTMIQNGNVGFKVTVLDENGNPVQGIKVDFSFEKESRVYSRTTDSKGVATININRNPGSYCMVSSIQQGGKVIKNTNTITIKADVLTIKGSNINVNQGTSAVFKVTVNDALGRPVQGVFVGFSFAGESRVYTRTTDANGVASININRNPGTYSMVSSVQHNGKTFKTTNSIVVNGKSMNIVSESATFIYGSNAVFRVTVKQANGAPAKNVRVAFSFVGESKVYYRTTNDEGIASININRNPNTYTMITTINDNGKTIQNANTITITKNAQYNVVANDLSMRYGDGSSFKIVVKDTKNVPLKGIKVGFSFSGESRVYYRTTDSTGTASIGIARAPGSYTIVMTLPDETKTTKKITIRK